LASKQNWVAMAIFASVRSAKADFQRAASITMRSRAIGVDVLVALGVARDMQPVEAVEGARFQKLHRGGKSPAGWATPPASNRPWVHAHVLVARHPVGSVALSLMIRAGKCGITS
jgi:hypothetical protein